MNKSTKFLILGLVTVACMLSLPIGAASTMNTLTDAFADEATNANPTYAAMYTYAEWAYNYAAVGTWNWFCINDTYGKLGGAANFTFKNSYDKSDTNYRYEFVALSFDFLYNGTKAKGQANHSAVQISFYGDSRICYMMVYGDNETNAGRKNKFVLYNSDHTVLLNTTINANTWYKVTITPAYAQDTYTVALYNVSGSAAISTVSHALNATENSATSLKFLSGATSGLSGNDTTWINMDNFIIYEREYSHGEQMANYISFYVLVLVLSLAILVSIMGLALTGNINPQSLIMLLVATIIGIITIIIINGL